MKQADAELSQQLIKMLLEQTKVETMAKTYNRLKPGKDGRIRTEQSPTGTETGRLNSRGSDWFPEAMTNLQNLPKKTAAGDPLYEVRNCVVADPGKVLVLADLSRAELYAYLAFAGDWKRIADMESGVDLHRNMAANIYELKPASVGYAERVVGKFANFSLGYGGGWKMFLGKVNKDADLTGVAIDAATAKRAVATWRELNPLTVRWWDEVKMEVANSGYLVNPFGRRRDFFGTGAGNDIIAHLPQSTIADHLNHALVRAHEAGLDVMLQVHDEIIIQADEESWQEDAKSLVECMQVPLVINEREILIPVEVSMSETSWAASKAIL